MQQFSWQIGPRNHSTLIGQNRFLWLLLSRPDRIFRFSKINTFRLLPTACVLNLFQRAQRLVQISTEERIWLLNKIRDRRKINIHIIKSQVPDRSTLQRIQDNWVKIFRHNCVVTGNSSKIHILRCLDVLLPLVSKYAFFALIVNVEVHTGNGK